MNFKLLVGVLFILLQLQFLFAKEKFKYKGNFLGANKYHPEGTLFPQKRRCNF